MKLEQKKQALAAIEKELSRYSVDAIRAMTPQKLERIVRGVPGAAAVLKEHHDITRCNIFVNSNTENIRNAFASLYRHCCGETGR